MSDAERVEVGTLTEDGSTPVAMPVVELLTGRGFATGKSGAGKSNTASVIAEELLDAGYPLLIVDTDGEYYGLKEEYEMLHAGADEECDIQVGPEHAERIATLALEDNVPIILDVSGYLEADAANQLIRETARHLFAKEKKLKMPFLLIVEEIHEFVPEQGGMDETGRMLIKIGKRGRKHGLGILGISQRPANVKKDFITQANWLVWHRLTWDNDTKVVGRIVDPEYGDRISELDDGEAFLQTDWTEADVRRVQFRRKRTFDAGATPGLEDFERPDLKSVSDSLVGDLQDITDERDRREDRIEDLEQRLAEKDRRIEELEREVESARDVSEAARRMAEAIATTDEDPDSTLERRLLEKDEEISRLRSEIARLEAELETTRADATGEFVDDGRRVDAVDRSPEDDEEAGTAASVRARARAAAADDHQATLGDVDTSTVLADDSDADDGPPAGDDDVTAALEAALSEEPTGGEASRRSRGSEGASNGTDRTPSGSSGRSTEPTVDAAGEGEPGGGRVENAGDRRDESASDDDGNGDTPTRLTRESISTAAWPDPKEGRPTQDGSRAVGPGAPHRDDTPVVDPAARSDYELACAGPVADRVRRACGRSQCDREAAWEVLATLDARGPATVADLGDLLNVSHVAVQSFLSELRSEGFLDREDRCYAFDRASLVALVRGSGSDEGAATAAENGAATAAKNGAATAAENGAATDTDGDDGGEGIIVAPGEPPGGRVGPQGASAVGRDD